VLPVATLLWALLAGGGLLTGWTVERTEGELRAELLSEMSRLTRSLQGQELVTSPRSRPRGDSPRRRRLAGQLPRVRPRDPFLYLVERRDDGRVYTLAASEPADGAGFRAPGEVWEGLPLELSAGFDRGLPVTAGPAHERWGVRVWTAAPVANPGGAPLLLLASVAGRVWYVELGAAALPPLLLTAFLAALLLVAAPLLGRRRREGAAAPVWLAYLEPVLAAAAGLALSLYAMGWAYDAETRRQRQTFSQMAAGMLTPVAETLHHLEGIDLAGFADFLTPLPGPGAEELAAYVRQLNRDPAVQMWAWAPRQGETPVHYPVRFAFPPAAAGVHVGLDLAADPARREALEDAAHSGQTVWFRPPPWGEDGQLGELWFLRPVVDRVASDIVKGFVMVVRRCTSSCDKSRSSGPRCRRPGRGGSLSGGARRNDAL